MPADIRFWKAAVWRAPIPAEGLVERQATGLRAVVDRHLELEKMAMAVAESAGTTQRASYEKVEKDRSDYEKHKERKEAFAQEVANMWQEQEERRHAQAVGAAECLGRLWVALRRFVFSMSGRSYRKV